MKTLPLLILLLSAFSIGSFGQSSQSFRVGAIDMFENGERAASNALTFNKSAECVQLNTGLNLNEGVKGLRDFDLTCKNYINRINVRFNLFPNPVVNSTRLQSSVLLNNPQPILLVVIDALGRVVLNKTVSAGLLYNGVNLNFSSLPAGSYYIKINTSDVHQFIPFIKVN
jgi:hypothetical protein